MNARSSGMQGMRAKLECRSAFHVDSAFSACRCNGIGQYTEVFGIVHQGRSVPCVTLSCMRMAQRSEGAHREIERAKESKRGRERQTDRKTDRQKD